LPWLPCVALMAGLAALSCGGGGGGSSNLDRTFGNGGKVITAIGTTLDEAFALAIQSDGQLVAAGTSSTGTQNEFALVRYNPDGSLDTTFNGTGIVTTAIGSSTDQAFALAIQADGKLVAAGYSDNGAQDLFALVRYNPDGSLDATFNGTGIVTTAIGTIADLASALAIQPDGRLVAAGLSITTGTRNEFALVRYNADGSLDTTFNTTGMVTTAIGGKGDQANALVIQPDGKLVAAGSSYSGTQNRFALARYNTDGSRDATFNGSGKVTTPIGNKGASASAVAIQADGKLVAAGYAFDKDYQADFALARYMP